MAKIDSILDSIEAGFQNPVYSMGTHWVPDEQMESLQVRRKKSGQPQHRLYYLSIGETGGQMMTFWGHRFNDCLLKALAWRGLPTKSKRGRKAAQ